MRTFLLVLLAMSLSTAHGQEKSVTKEMIEKDLAEFSTTYYPSFDVNYLKTWGSKGIAFEYWDQNDSEYSCAAVYYGSSAQVLLVQCVDQENRGSPETVYYHAFVKHDDKLVDSKQDIFPIREIFDQLQYFVVDSEEVESLLSQESEEPALHNFIEFEFGEDDSLLVSIRSIEGVIEGAVYTSMIWDENQHRFVIEN